ncbi:MAG TPA: aminopeptidase P family N-terminal domain-containing protein, partial [Bauldia sp.]|nr:aminopeptidase P family N-terminal domain-containing protein [Bauldia sp.]
MNKTDSAIHATSPAPSDRLARLRGALATQKLAGFIVPHADEHQSEYLPASAERLAWLTGFTGSAGMAIVLRNQAALFVDGRYTTQAEQQADRGFDRQHLIETPPAKWLSAHAKKGDRIGYDPWLMTVGEVRRFAEAAARSGAELVAVSDNPLDAIWTDRPEPPLGAVALHPVELAGEDAAAKIARLQDDLKATNADAAILTQADSIAWLLNIRGSDIAHNPVALAYLVLPAGGKPQLFIDGRKLSNSVRDALSAIAEPAAPAAFGPALDAFAGKRVLIDPQTTSAAIARRLTEAGAS